MSLWNDSARQYLAEIYDERISEEFGVMYADLGEEARKDFDDFIDAETDRLVWHLRKAVDGFMQDAPELPDGFEADDGRSDPAESPDPNWMNP